MKCELDEDFHDKLKRLRKNNRKVWQSFWNTLELFEQGKIVGKDLNRELEGYKRIIITEDNKYAAIYREIGKGDELVAKFVDIGHKQYLYK